MSAVTMHREAVKAEIRMKHGSLTAFAVTEGLDPQQVRDTLRGTSSAAKAAVAKLLGVNVDHLTITSDSTKVESSTTSPGAPHRLNAEAR